MQANSTGVAAPTLIPDLREWAVLLDVDGTIVDLAPTPADIHVPASLIEPLRHLNEKTKGATALVSGRTLRDLDQIFAPLRLAVVGGHGAELRLAAGAQVLREHVGGVDPALKRALATIAHDSSGILFDDKGYSLALHYRLVPPRGRFPRRAGAAIRAQLPAQKVEVVDGPLLIGNKHKGYSKGSAVRELMRHPPFAG